MFNNRMLAVAAVLALAVPTLGAAAPIVAPPAYEQLVEGHTVFTVIEVFRNTTTVRAEFAAAVAVLVREYDAIERNVRFPGVLWFNDQYLVNPTDGGSDSANFRYPCGGSVMAVNAGDPDPRVILANVGSSGETRDVITGVDYGDAQADPTPADDTDDPTYAWANVTTDGPTPTANSDTVLTNTFDYDESYLITDPNDHMWIIDKYTMYTRVGTSGSIDPATGTFSPVVYSRPVWAVNILGSPVFLPDDGIASCGPYSDLASTLYAASGLDNAAIADAATQADNTIGTVNTGAPYKDDPILGYNEPSDNGYCYNGNPAPCAPIAPTSPIRIYNALLYFKLGDLDQAGAAKDHTVHTDPTDTNGCQVGTEWECPGDDDNREGNSHPFHPTPGAGRNPPNGVHTEAGYPCPAGFSERDPLNPAGNHGGSSIPAEYGSLCGNDHATFNVDIYFSPAGRPFPPVVRSWSLYDGPGGSSLTSVDTQGSTAPFHGPTAHHAP